MMSDFVEIDHVASANVGQDPLSLLALELFLNCPIADVGVA